MRIERRAKKGGYEGLGLAERKIDRRQTGCEPFEQLREARERRADQFVEAIGRVVGRHAAGVTGWRRSRQWGAASQEANKPRREAEACSEQKSKEETT